MGWRREAFTRMQEVLLPPSVRAVGNSSSDMDIIKEGLLLCNILADFHDDLSLPQARKADIV